MDGNDDGGGGGPYAAQAIGGMAAIADDGSSDGGNLFGEIVGKGLQTGLGTIAGLGYGCVFFEFSTPLPTLFDQASNGSVVCCLLWRELGIGIHARSRHRCLYQVPVPG
jgi:hypothetical protein